MYKVIDAFKVKEQTIVALDKKRNVSDLGAKVFICDIGNFAVNWVHPKEYVSIQFSGDPQKLIGKSISLSR